jgi:hypothetical protein
LVTLLMTESITGASMNMSTTDASAAPHSSPKRYGDRGEAQ